MKKYSVLTTVTLSRSDVIEADSIDDAEEQAEKRYNEPDSEWHCNDNEDFDDVEFTAQPEIIK